MTSKKQHEIRVELRQDLQTRHQATARGWKLRSEVGEHQGNLMRALKGRF